MIRAVATLSALFLGIGLLMLGMGLLGTLLGLRMAMDAVPATVIGTVMSSYFIGLVAGTLVAHRIIASAGHIRSFTAFASVLSAATLSHAFFFDPYLWIALRLIEGFCISGLFMCTESWLNSRAEVRNRGRLLTFYTLTLFLAQGMGQFLLLLGDVRAFMLFAIASVLMSLAVVPVALTRIPQPDPPSPDRLGFGRLFRLTPLGIAQCFASGLVLGSFYGMGPLFAQGIGLDVAGTAQFMGLAIFGGMLLQWPVGRIADRFDRRRVLLGINLAVVLLAVVLALNLDKPLWLLVALVMLFGGVAATIYPVGVAHAADVIPRDQLVSASGSLLLAYGVGAALGPFASALAMDGLGPRGLFAAIALAATATAAFAFWRLKGQPPVPEEDKTEFVAVPQTSPMAPELDPRTETEDDRQFSFDFERAAAPFEGPPADDGGPIIEDVEVERTR